MSDAVFVMSHPAFLSMRRTGPRGERYYLVELALEERIWVSGDTVVEACESARLILEHYDAKQEREHGTATG